MSRSTSPGESFCMEILFGEEVVGRGRGKSKSVSEKLSFWFDVFESYLDIRSSMSVSENIESFAWGLM